MNEEDWDAGAHPLDMMEEALAAASSARMRVFAAEVCRAIGRPDAAGVLAGAPAEDALRAHSVQNQPWPPVSSRNNPIRLSRREQQRRVVYAAAGPSPWDAVWGTAAGAFPVLWADLIPLVQCIFPNPFRPVAFAPGWRTSTAVGLATTIGQSRDFAALPILADALEDAGCDNADVLAHCRGPGPHVRGCWAVDLVLGEV